MRNQLPQLIEDAVKDRENPNGDFQNLLQVSNGLQTTNESTTFRLSMLGLIDSLPSRTDSNLTFYLTPKGEHVLGQIRSKVAELETGNLTDHKS